MFDHAGLFDVDDANVARLIDASLRYVWCKETADALISAVGQEGDRLAARLRRVPDGSGDSDGDIDDAAQVACAECRLPQLITLPALRARVAFFAVRPRVFVPNASALSSGKAVIAAVAASPNSAAPCRVIATSACTALQTFLVARAGLSEDTMLGQADGAPGDGGDAVVLAADAAREADRGVAGGAAGEYAGGATDGAAAKNTDAAAGAASVGAAGDAAVKAAEVDVREAVGGGAVEAAGEAAGGVAGGAAVDRARGASVRATSEVAVEAADAAADGSTGGTAGEAAGRSGGGTADESTTGSGDSTADGNARPSAAVGKGVVADATAASRTVTGSNSAKTSGSDGDGNNTTAAGAVEAQAGRWRGQEPIGVARPRQMTRGLMKRRQAPAVDRASCLATWRRMYGSWRFRPGTAPGRRSRPRRLGQWQTLLAL